MAFSHLKLRGKKWCAAEKTTLEWKSVQFHCGLCSYAHCTMHHICNMHINGLVCYNFKLCTIFNFQFRQAELCVCCCTVCNTFHRFNRLFVYFHFHLWIHFTGSADETQPQNESKTENEVVLIEQNRGEMGQSHSDHRRVVCVCRNVQLWWVVNNRSCVNKFIVDDDL